MSTEQALLWSIIAAVVPTAVYVMILWWLDRYEKEPRRLLWSAFIWGAAPAVILSLVGESILQVPLGDLSAGGAELVSSSFLAPLVEELAKGVAVLLIFLLFRNEFDNVLDGIIYGATIGFGFAMTENVFYFMDSFGESGVDGLTAVILMRSVVFGLNHALFTSVFGATLGYAKQTKTGCLRWLAPPLGLVGAMLLHGIHNLFASLSGEMCFTLVISFISDWAGVLVILVVLWLSANQEKRWITEYLRPEVTSGLISQADYDMICSYRKRQAALWRARLKLDKGETRRVGRLARLATELAFKLHQGDEKTAQALRQQIAALGGNPPVQGGTIG